MVIGIEAAFLIGGLIVTETFFNIAGVARFLVDAILVTTRSCKTSSCSSPSSWCA
jgi:ABC-type dipeptide/oligopeptide/nickel transport system permease component